MNAICAVGTYSHHYAYSAHVKAAACMLRSSGVAFVAACRFPGIGWYNIGSRLDYCCPAVSLPGVDRLGMDVYIIAPSIYDSMAEDMNTRD